jgi:hypothetical protein
MATSYKHAQHSVKRFGGKPEDYIAIHEFFDESKKCLGDIRHRAILHNTFGTWLVEKVFGRTILVEGKQVSVREVAEQHILDDLGFIPTIQDWLRDLPIETWMSGTVKREYNRKEFVENVIRRNKNESI